MTVNVPDVNSEEIACLETMETPNFASTAFLIASTQKLGKQFVITTELGPTEGTDVATTLEKARSYTKLDGINIHDCPMARLRINSVALAYMVQDELGIDTIPHFTCWDRSLLGIQGLLG